MNPRDVGPPTKETTVDDPLELFLPESRVTGTAEPAALPDLEELPLPRWPPAVTAASMARRRRDRFVSAAGVVVVAIVLAWIVAAAGKNRSDVTPLPGQVLPPADVVRSVATTESTTGITDSRPATVPPAKPAAAAKKPVKVQQPSTSSARNRAAVSRPTPPARTAVARREEPRRPPPAVAATTPSSAVAAVNSAPPVPIVSSAPAIPIVSSPPAVPVVSSPPAVPVVIPAPAVPVVSSAAPVTAPSPAPPPSAPISAPTPTPSAGVTDDARAVGVALNRYQEAFSALDVNAAHAVWPNVDVKALARAFDQLDEQTFHLEGCNITVAGARAQADCGGNTRYVRKVGNKGLRVEPRRWHFTLRQTSDRWVIDAVDAR
jgi:hypothetical protein